MLAADRAIGVFPKLQLAELHSQGIVEQQPVLQGMSDSQDDLHCFGGLHDPNQTREDAKHAAFCTARDEAGRRRFRIQTAVARAVLIRKYSGLALKPEN